MKKAKDMFPPPDKQRKGTSYPKGILQGKKGKKERKKDHAWQVQIAKQVWTVDNKQDSKHKVQ